MSVQVGVHSSSEPSSPRPPKHHVGGGSASSSEDFSIAGHMPDEALAASAE